MKIVQCSGHPEIYARLEGVHLPHMSSLLHGYMCIWCTGFPEIYAQLEEGGWGQSVMKLMQCSGLPVIYTQLGGSVWQI